MKRQKTALLVLLIFLSSMLVSTLWVNQNAAGILADNYENDSRVIAGLVGNAIEKELLRPIIVSETISKAQSTHEFLSVEAHMEAEALAETAAQFLSTLRDGFGYSIVFAASDFSKAFFTPDGITYYLDPEHNDTDSWYQEVAYSDQAYLLEIGADELSNWSTSVFVNTKVYDEQHRFLGVCGVGVSISELQKLLDHYERIYHIHIALTDAQGTVLVDSDGSQKNNERILIDDLTEFSDGEMYYEIRQNGNRTITYLETPGWYLVIRDNFNRYNLTTDILRPGLICTVLGLFLICFVFERERKQSVPVHAPREHRE